MHAEQDFALAFIDVMQTAARHGQKVRFKRIFLGKPRAIGRRLTGIGH